MIPIKLWLKIIIIIIHVNAFTITDWHSSCGEADEVY